MPETPARSQPAAAPWLPDDTDTPAADAGSIATTDPIPYLEVGEDGCAETQKAIALETSWPLVVNGQLWLTLLCTPNRLPALVLGFLFNEGIIRALTDVRDVTVTQFPEAVIRVELHDRTVSLPQHRTLTSGCGGGITFLDMAAQRQPLSSPRTVSVGQVLALMQRLVASVAEEHRDIGGFHTSALSFGERLDILATDIGRHNTLDKLAGECLLRGLSARDAILLATGRVSAEMLGKAAQLGTPIVVTRSSPTSLAVALARAWQMTLIGYARGRRVHVYTGAERVAECRNV